MPFNLYDFAGLVDADRDAKAGRQRDLYQVNASVEEGMIGRCIALPRPGCARLLVRALLLRAGIQSRAKHRGGSIVRISEHSRILCFENGASQTIFGQRRLMPRNPFRPSRPLSLPALSG